MKIIVNLFMIFFGIFPLEAYEKEITVCAIFQNEAPFLKEWIEYHKIIGVEHFFLYNHQSRDSYKKVLAPYIKSGDVTLINWPGNYETLGEWLRIQASAYMDCSKKLLGKTKWIAYLDIDEFLVPVQKYKLNEVLKDYEGYGGLKVNWVLFGTSNIRRLRVNQLMISQLVRRASLDFVRNNRIKTIARPECLLIDETLLPTKDQEIFCDSWSDHAPIFKPETPAVNERGEPEYRRSVENPSVEKIRINHYWMRSEEYFLKRKRHSPNRFGRLSKKGLEKFAHYNAQKDTLILRYQKPLTKSMKNRGE